MKQQAFFPQKSIWELDMHRQGKGIQTLPFYQAKEQMKERLLQHILAKATFHQTL